MNTFSKNKFLGCLLVSQILYTSSTSAQWNINKDPIDFDLQHGITQYEDGNYVQAIHTLESYLSEQPLPLENDRSLKAPNLSKELAMYYMTLSKIKYGADDLEESAQYYLSYTVNQVHKDRIAIQLGHHYFNNQLFEKAIPYFEMVDIRNLNNEEIADLKFEQAYSYFVSSHFVQAYPLFAAIKELESNKYYNAGNYYFGILAYHRKQYDAALTSFRRIDQLPEYADVVPYYLAEIYYFKGENDRVLAIAREYIDGNKKLHYNKELHLLAGKVLYDEKNYRAALPYLQYHYDQSDKIRKENLYELAVTNYQLGNMESAITLFKPLSNADDSMAQSSMYMLGDAYLQSNDKQGAKNAFSIAAGMSHLPEVQEASQFLSAKLSYELGEDQLAAQGFRSYIAQYPNSPRSNQAKELLVTLLSNSKDYQTAYDILSEMPLNNTLMQTIYQRVTFGRALQLLRNGNQSAASTMLNQSFQYKNDIAVLGAAQFWKSQLLFNEKKFSESASLIKQFIQQAKANGKNIREVSKEATLANAYTHLGYVEMELNQFENAQSSFALAQNNHAGGDNAAGDSRLNNLLQADAAFMNKKYDEAYNLYNKAIQAFPQDAAYPLYQKALIAGIQGNNSEKNTLLNKVIKEYPKHAQSEWATYELGSSYIELENYTEAIRLLSPLANNGLKEIHPKALSKLAYAYQNSNNCDKAISIYKQFIETFPSHQEKDNAILGLRNCYVQKNDLESYYSYTQSKGIQSMEGNESMEKDFFELAENKFIDEQYSAAILSFNEYLTKFPSATNKPQVYYLIAESYYELKQMDKALKAYQDVTEYKNTDYASLAYLKLANIHFENKDYNKTIAAANQFIASQDQIEPSIPAHLLLMKSFIQTQQYDEAAESAKILSNNDEELSASEKNEVQLVLGIQSMNDEKYDEARNIFTKIANANVGAVSAEARYRIAETFLLQNKLTEAEDAADKAIQANQSEHFWMVKCYILIGEIMGAQNDYFNARATLQSVINNANNPELEKEAKEKLEIINQKEKNNSKVIND